MENLVLFGEQAFETYSRNRMVQIAKNILNMSDVEVLMYKDDFENLLKKLVKMYSLLPVDISFEDKLVDLIDRPNKNGSHYFAEYTLMVTGDSELLGLDPYNKGYVELPVPVAVKTNVISFEIDTHFDTEKLTLQVMDDVKREYDIIKKFITNTLLPLNNESQKFNLQLEEFIIPILAQKMRRAYNHSVIKQKLNFK